MITIRPEQLIALEADRTSQFDEALVAHLEAAYPAPCAKIGVTRAFVTRSRLRAVAHGLVTHDAITAFLELLVLHGEQFENSPDGDQALELLAAPEYPGQIKIKLLVECLLSRAGGRRVLDATP
jgi:hypothetical protein